MKKIIPQPIKNIYHLFQAVLANFIYGFPGRNIKVIGVTGTNGKTTTVQMITKILEEAGRKVAMASTINFKIGEKEWVNKSKFTTLSSFQIQKFILDAVKSGCKYLVLETSSHSLDQYRVWGIKFDTAVITNVTREHLDYHETMEEYRAAKLKLFRKAKTAVVNLDMERPEEYLDCKAENIFGYSLEISNSKLQIPNKYQIQNYKFQTAIAENIEEGINYTKYQIQNTKYLLNLPGRFNVENALAAACVGISEGINLETIAKALEKIKGIPGRMEYVPNGKGMNIIIDYAVTPDSLEKLYSLVTNIKKNLPLEKGEVRRTEGFEEIDKFFKSSPNPSFSKGGESKIIAVFGACGERDHGKRPMMGEIVSRYADYIILTNEDPYGENPVQIINEIESGIRNKESGKGFWKIMDRREAIKKALQIAKPGDYIIVTGKGAEETMAIGNKRIPWNDKKVILEVLQGVSSK